MHLEEVLAKRFKAEFKKIFDKEKVEKAYLNQDDFPDCESRAREAIEIASELVIKDLGYCIAVHREKEHGEDTMAEQASLLEAGADPEIGVRGFWSE